MSETISSKPFLTYEQQIDKLINDKGLIIKDRVFAINMLTAISYYSLIDGYKNVFYDVTRRKYRIDTTFEDIYTLYEFDKCIRELIFSNICYIEQSIRSIISYYFCEKYSHCQTAYLTTEHYNNTPSNHRAIQRLINILSNEANIKTSHPYVVYHRTSYGNVPLWVVVKTLTFGQISAMYSLLTTDLKSKVSHNFYGVNERQLEQYLKFLTDVRNACAHNERIFNHRSRFEIPNTLLHLKMEIPQIGVQYIYGKNDLFATIIAFRYLLPQSSFLRFKKVFSNYLQNLLRSGFSLSELEILNAMNLPDNWKTITRFKRY